MPPYFLPSMFPTLEKSFFKKSYASFKLLKMPSYAQKELRATMDTRLNSPRG